MRLTSREKTDMAEKNVRTMKLVRCGQKSSWTKLDLRMEKMYGSLEQEKQIENKTKTAIQRCEV